MLAKSELFRTSTGAAFRMLGMDRNDRGIVHVLGMLDPKALPRQWRLADLKDGLATGRYERLPVSALPVVIPVSSEDEGDPSRKLAAWRWRLIEPLANDPNVFWRHLRGPLVAARSKATGASKQTIMACLRLYWRGGMSRDALLPEFRKCGISSVSTSAGKVRGANTTRRLYEKFHFSDADKQKVLRLATREYNKGKTRTGVTIYRRVILSLYTFSDADGKTTQRPLGERPSYAQVMYLLGTTLTLEKTLRRKHGDDKFENDFRPKTGSARVYAGGVGQYFEIDSTITDIWLCAESDAATVIGKATLYLIVDRFSRLIVGFYLTLDKPSWATAMEAMLSVVADKRELCERWGFDYLEEDWPAHGIWPAFWVADRGTEFICHASDAVVEGVEGGLINAPPRRPVFKGGVECAFKLSHVQLKDTVGGYTPPADFGKRQTSDHKSEATRTLRSLGNEILHFIRFNNHRVHKGIKLPAEDVYLKFQPIPAKIWKTDYEDRAGGLSKFSEDYMRFKLLPKAKATVTKRGILFNGVLYQPERRFKDDWLLRATRGTFEVDATYERRLIDAIYLHDDKDPTRWMTVHLSEQFISYAGLSWAEMESIENARMTLDDLADEHNLTLALRHDVAAISREKVAQSAVNKAISKAPGRARTNGGLAQRLKEVKQNKVQTKVLRSTTGVTTTTEPNVSAAAPFTRIASSPTKGAARPSPAPVSAPSVVIASPPAKTTANAALQALLNLRKRS